MKSRELTLDRASLSVVASREAREKQIADALAKHGIVIYFTGKYSKPSK